MTFAAGFGTVEHFIAIPFEDAPINPGWTNYEDWIGSHTTAQPPDPGLDETDLLSINYTSGTTARPEGRDDHAPQRLHQRIQLHRPSAHL